MINIEERKDELKKLILEDTLSAQSQIISSAHHAAFSSADDEDIRTIQDTIKLLTHICKHMCELKTLKDLEVCKDESP